MNMDIKFECRTFEDIFYEFEGTNDSFKKMKNYYFNAVVPFINSRGHCN